MSDQVTLSSTYYGSGWRFSITKVTLLLDELEIEYPIAVALRTYPITKGMTRFGHHTCRRRGNTAVHIVWINKNLSEADANETLIHELVHAHQLEREVRLNDVDPLKFHEMYISGNAIGDAQLSYGNNKFEVEARNMAKKLIEVDKIWLMV
jgi:hypothetical protein